jgi:ferrous iron transport protein B
MIDVTPEKRRCHRPEKAGGSLQCQVVETSALRGEGSRQAAQKAAELARKGQRRQPPHVFQGSVEHAWLTSRT